ncbi:MULTISPECIES: hypothetical protein [Pseudomonas syringae group]|uniref:hypothetical protein n=1 Tax=Pseudomonas syringae group TaxID=136849 RepID=UPI000F009C01|nr:MULTISPECIES: hypothetical protein [Pseudomonas syringae group]MDH4602458.1 hypothetical protein [Pseudomonas syringae pv. papulans]
MSAEGFGGQLSSIGISIGDMFVNLSAEYPVILDMVILVFATAGVIISASAIFDFIKLGGRDRGNGGSPIAYKMIAGCSLVDLAFWTNVWTDTIWSQSDPMDISSYTSSAGHDNGLVAIYAVIGFLVIVGYVTLGKAYYQVSRLGYLSPEARGDMWGSIISRVVAGSLMVASLHVAKMFEDSVGFNFIPS